MSFRVSLRRVLDLAVADLEGGVDFLALGGCVFVLASAPCGGLGCRCSSPVQTLPVGVVVPHGHHTPEAVDSSPVRKLSVRMAAQRRLGRRPSFGGSTVRLVDVRLAAVGAASGGI